MVAKSSRSSSLTTGDDEMTRSGEPRWLLLGCCAWCKDVGLPRASRAHQGSQYHWASTAVVVARTRESVGWVVTGEVGVRDGLEKAGAMWMVWMGWRGEVEMRRGGKMDDGETTTSVHVHGMERGGRTGALAWDPKRGGGESKGSRCFWVAAAAAAAALAGTCTEQSRASGRHFLHTLAQRSSRRAQPRE